MISVHKWAPKLCMCQNNNKWETRETMRNISTNIQALGSCENRVCFVCTIDDVGEFWKLSRGEIWRDRKTVPELQLFSGVVGEGRSLAVGCRISMRLRHWRPSCCVDDDPNLTMNAWGMNLALKSLHDARICNQRELTVKLACRILDAARNWRPLMAEQSLLAKLAKLRRPTLRIAEALDAEMQPLVLGKL